MHSGAGASSAPESSEVPEMAEPSKTEQRKAEHVNIILQENVSAEYNYWNDVRLVHTALPEIDLDDVDVSVKFFGKRLAAPLIISSMTGGFGMGIPMLPTSFTLTSPSLPPPTSPQRLP